MSKRTMAAWIAMLLLGLSPGLAKEMLFRIEDPFGDDHGDGSLRYPLRDDMEPGDLDVVELAAAVGDDGTTFRVTFARPIRAPGKAAVDSLGTSRDEVARLGFYTFNIDLYIDVDRRPGSGYVAMLPGRKAEVVPIDAWEKAIVLTPRPHVLRQAVERASLREWKEEESRKRTLTREEVRRRKKQIAEELLPLVFFPTQVRTFSRTVEFFVPRAFLGDDARDTWAYVLVVTGAQLEQRVALPVPFFGGRLPEDSYDGLIMPVVPGRDRDAFGGGLENEPLQPPLIDILVPPGDSQERILSTFNSFQEHPAQVPGVVPVELER